MEAQTQRQRDIVPDQEYFSSSNYKARLTTSNNQRSTQAAIEDRTWANKLQTDRSNHIGLRNRFGGKKGGPGLGAGIEGGKTVNHTPLDRSFNN